MAERVTGIEGRKQAANVNVNAVAKERGVLEEVTWNKILTVKIPGHLGDSSPIATAQPSGRSLLMKTLQE